MKERKIIYVADTRLPTERAHGLALMKLCGALVEAGAEVEVIAPKLWTRSAKDPFLYYRVATRFPIHYLWSLDLLPLRIFRRVLYLIQVLSFSLVSLMYCARRYRSESVVYVSHDYIPLYFLSFLGHSLYYDIHHFPGRNFMYRRLMRLACGFSVQTKWKVDELIKNYRVPRERIVYWPNGTDVEMFALNEDAMSARSAVALPTEGKLIVYMGTYIPWKGIETLITALAHLEGNVTLALVGWSMEDAELLKKNVTEAKDKRILFIPFAKREMVPHYLRAADVLALPNTGRKKVSLYYTSPMKLFEYMASGRPIVASRIPSLEEVLTEGECFFAKPDDPADFARALKEALGSPDASKRGERARQRAQRYTWKARADAILPHLFSCSHVDTP